MRAFEFDYFGDVADGLVQFAAARCKVKRELSTDSPGRREVKKHSLNQIFVQRYAASLGVSGLVRKDPNSRGFGPTTMAAVGIGT